MLPAQAFSFPQRQPKVQRWFESVKGFHCDFRALLWKDCRARSQELGRVLCKSSRAVIDVARAGEGFLLTCSSGWNPNFL